MPNPANVLPELVTGRETQEANPYFGQLSQKGGNVAVNEQLVASGLGLLRAPLSRYVCEAIAEKYGDSWWIEGVLEILTFSNAPTVEDVRRHRHLPESATVEDGADVIDISTCLLLLTKHWPRVFEAKLSRSHRGWAYELIPVRNANKHLAGKDHESDYAWRALDTMFRVCEPIDAVVASEIKALRSEVDLSSYGQHATVEEQDEAVETGLPDLLLPEVTMVTDAETATQIEPNGMEQSEEDEILASGPDFSGADLRGMNFAGVNLEGADFSDADLTDVNFVGASLARAVFKGAELGNTNFTEANLKDAYFESVTLSYTRDEGPRDQVVLVIRGANFTGATLDGATLNFAGTDAKKTIFAGVNLEGADFSDADLTDTHFKGAILRGVNLKGANIKDANTFGVQWV